MLGRDSGSQLDVFLRDGPYGPYLQLGEAPLPGDADAAKPRRAPVKLKGYANDAATRLLVWLLQSRYQP